MKIEINNQAGYKIDLRPVRKIISAFGRTYKINKNKEISLAFVSDAAIKKLNLAYRGVNQATDVLAFAPLNADEGDELGEIIIDYNQIKRQAGDFKNSAEKELIFILVHGLYHLIGYDHKTDKQRLKMIKLGEEFIKNNL